MATISLNVSTDHGSTIEIQPLENEGDCLSISVRTNMPPLFEGDEPWVFSRDWVTVHGSVADIRCLAQRMLSALPAEVPTESVEA